MTRSPAAGAATPSVAAVRRPARRQPLSRERVLRAALAVADREGIVGLTIRSLAAELGTKPMSVYHYVANKDAILDGIVDLVFDEIHLRRPGRTGARRSASARRRPARSWAATDGPSDSWSHGQRLAPRRSATTKRSSPRCGRPASRWSWPRMPTRCWTAMSTASPSRRLHCRSTTPNVTEVAGPITDAFLVGKYPHMASAPRPSWSSSPAMHSATSSLSPPADPRRTGASASPAPPRG